MLKIYLGFIKLIFVSTMEGGHIAPPQTDKEHLAPKPGHYLFTSESVTSGHPDKLCDYISDSVLDACLEVDPNSKVACETAVKNSLCMMFG